MRDMKAASVVGGAIIVKRSGSITEKSWSQNHSKSTERIWGIRRWASAHSSTKSIINVKLWTARSNLLSSRNRNRGIGFRVNAVRDDTCGLHSTCRKSSGNARDLQTLHTREADFKDRASGSTLRSVSLGWSCRRVSDGAGSPRRRKITSRISGGRSFRLKGASMPFIVMAATPTSQQLR